MEGGRGGGREGMMFKMKIEKKEKREKTKIQTPVYLYTIFILNTLTSCLENIFTNIRRIS